MRRWLLSVGNAHERVKQGTGSARQAGFELGGSPARLPVSSRFRCRRDERRALDRHARRLLTPGWARGVAGDPSDVAHALSSRLVSVFCVYSISLAGAHAHPVAHSSTHSTGAVLRTGKYHIHTIDYSSSLVSVSDVFIS